MTDQDGPAMTSHSDTRPDHWCHLHRFQRFKVILLLAIVSVVILAFYTGGITVRNPTKLDTTDKYADFYSTINNSIDIPSKDVRKLRILCLIMTMEKDLHSKVSAVNNTWAKRCHKHYYVIYSSRKRHDFLNVDVPDNRKLLVDKMKFAYNFVYKNHIDDFDYLLKADDDTYVIIENLQLLMSNYPSSEPGYLGFHFNKFVRLGYMSGGAGYVITNSGLRHLVERGYNKNLCPVIYRPEDKENSEDIETGRCLQFAGVPRLSSLDVEGKQTFHPYTLHKHLFGGVPAYVFEWAKDKVGKGKNCCSRYSISFHYMTPDAMLYTDHLLYDTTVYGVTGQNRNDNNVFKIGQVV